MLEGAARVQAKPGVSRLTLELDSRGPEDVLAGRVEAGARLIRHTIDGPTELTFSLEGCREVVVCPSSPSAAGPEGANVRFRAVVADGTRIEVNPRATRQRLARPDLTTFLPTYDSVVALSEYTRQWAQRWWGRGDHVLSPPVVMRRGGRKENVILAVGRFFDERSGHSKRQLELVHAFRRLVESGLEGWRLVLIGGCSGENRDYAMAVRAAARGLPVEVRLNVPGSFLDESFAAASIFWHAAGLGADLEAHPDRAEHFGIAPIEAMSAGAVPIVFGAAGPSEVVQHEVNGLQYHSIDELADATRRVIDDPALRQRLAQAAVERAQEYDRAHFEAKVRALVADLTTDER
jgi:glycosyltransferase involved in cell wall biosynthesis